MRKLEVVVQNHHNYVGNGDTNDNNYRLLLVLDRHVGGQPVNSALGVRVMPYPEDIVRNSMTMLRSFEGVNPNTTDRYLVLNIL